MLSQPPSDKFALVFGNLLETLFIERMDQNEEIFARYMNDPAFQALVAQWLAADVYRRLGGTPAQPIVKYPPVKKLPCEHAKFPAADK